MNGMKRSGISPVVAMVLLLMMAVASAGALYAWTQGIIGGQQEQATQELNTQIQVRNLQCTASNGNVNFFLDNTGSTTVAAGDVTAYLYSVSDGSLINTVSISHSDLAPGDSWNGNVDYPDGDMTAGNEYRVEFEFTNQNSYTVSSTCQAE